MSSLVFVLGVAGSLGLLVGAALMVVRDRLELRDALRHIDNVYEIVDIRDQELTLSLEERVLAPFRASLNTLGRRFTPADYLQQTRSRLVRAGKPEQSAVDRFVAIRAATILAAPFAFFISLAMMPLDGTLKLFAAGLMAAGLVYMPEKNLESAVVERETSIRKQLPDIMDLLVVCVEAGLGFNAAVSRTVASLEGEMSDEFSLMLGEMRAGSSRGDALQGLAERVQVPEIQSFVSAIKQADRFGISISTVLRAQAEEMRIKRKQIAQEKAQKAPVKMLLPMVGFIFPPMFIIIIGPAGIQITQSGGI